MIENDVVIKKKNKTKRTKRMYSFLLDKEVYFNNYHVLSKAKEPLLRFQLLLRVKR